MKFSTRTFFAAVLGLLALAGAWAQQQPVLTVSITNVAVLSGQGEVAFIDLTNVGSGYQSAPTVTFTASPTGNPADTAQAFTRINLGGAVSDVVITNPGFGYTSRPNITFSAPTGVNAIRAEATAFLGSVFSQPFQNESYGPAGTPIAITALAVGTFPASGFTYQYFVNGVSIGTAAAHPPAGTPAAVGWTPPQPGAYFLTVTASDGARTVASLPVRYFATGTALLSPTPNTLVPNGSAVVLQATATPRPLLASGTSAFVSRIDFYADGALIGSDSTWPYSLIYTPLPSPGVHVVEARAFDNENNQISPNFHPDATLNLRMVTPIGVPPTSIISSPSNDASIAIGDGGVDVPVRVDAHSPSGLITKVELYVDGKLHETDTIFPYSFTWKPTVVGTYRLVALAYDDKNNVAASTTSTSPTSTPAPTTVVIAAPPSVTLASPINGSTVTGGSPITIVALATDSNLGGTVTSVRFFANGTFIGEDTTPSADNQFSITAALTPSSSVSLTAIALNNRGVAATSQPVSVSVTASGGTGAGPTTGALDRTATGIISGPGEAGTFAVTSLRDKTISFLGTSTVNGVTKRYVFTDVPIAANGSFTASDAEGNTTISGTFSNTGASGTLDNGRVAFSGALSLPGLVTTVAPGYYTGNIEGRAGSTLTGIVAPDGSISLHVTDGSFVAGGSGAVTATGAFDLATNVPGVRFQGTANPTTGFLRGTIVGGPGGTLLAATSGSTLQGDGFLRNLSTRGQVGAGDNTLIAGFVITGTTPKQVLIRALGSSLAAAGITAPLANPYLRVLNSSNVTVAENDNWEFPIGPAPVSAATLSGTAAALGTGVLGSGSTDAAVLTTLSPGVYTVLVTGVGGATGIGLVELYDADNQAPASPQRLVNVSTRGRVGTDQAQLIAGFIVNGTKPKKVLIRAAGPSLAAVAPSLAGSVLTDPKLQLVRISSAGNTLVRENDDWETGNDVADVMDIAAQSGAFSFVRGSKDAVILINVPPGIYTAHVTGAGTTSGLALVEVYEAP